MKNVELKNKAGQAVVDHVDRARKNLDLLDRKLLELKLKALRGEVSWGHAGSACKVSGDVRELLQALLS